MRFGAVARRALALAILATGVGLGAGVLAARLVVARVQEQAVGELKAVARDLDACLADPSRWVRLGEPSTFAYDGTDYTSRNSSAPPYVASRALALGELSVHAPATPFGRSWIAIRAREHGPCSVLQRYWPRRAPAALVQGIGLTAAGAGLCLTLTLGLLGIVRPLVRSTSRVAASASQVGRPDGYQAPGDLESDDLQQIVAALSSSHARILAAEKSAADRLFALERHMAQVAHDLRTPLTALQLSIEEALEQSDILTARGALTQALEESVYLAGLTENLRLSARRRETGTFGGQAQRIDLREIIDRVCSRMRILARRKSMTFGAELGQYPVLAECSPLGVERALSNVIENAVVHGPNGGMVHVRLEVCTGSFSLSVENDGPGPEHASETQRAGSGLGMRITHEVAREAGWNVRITSRDPTGTQVVISGSSSNLQDGSDAR